VARNEQAEERKRKLASRRGRQVVEGQDVDDVTGCSILGDKGKDAAGCAGVSI